MLTVVAILCSLNGTVCRSEIVTDQATPMECAIQGQANIADWMGKHPIYSHGWRLQGYTCTSHDHLKVPA